DGIRDFHVTGVQTCALPIFGTVSESGGVPTGAIIESGSNANGDYVRWAGGVQECWTVMSGGSSTRSWTFPASFIAAPVVSIAMEIGRASCRERVQVTVGSAA